jgi:hypothetical protein
METYSKAQTSIWGSRSVPNERVDFKQTTHSWISFRLRPFLDFLLELLLEVMCCFYYSQNTVSNAFSDYWPCGVPSIELEFPNTLVKCMLRVHLWCCTWCEDIPGVESFYFIAVIQILWSRYKLYIGRCSFCSFLFSSKFLVGLQKDYKTVKLLFDPASTSSTSVDWRLSGVFEISNSDSSRR